MVTLLKVVYESIGQAFDSLTGNKLRTVLSLLGITIGIFCIIGVQSAVDSLEDNVREGMSKLGDDVVYVQKFSWMSSPDEWWKYRRRPNVQFADFEALQTKMNTAKYVTYHYGIGGRTAKWRNNSVEGAYLIAITEDYDRMFQLNFERGRFFSASEYFYGAPKCVLGGEVARELFGEVDPIGKTINVRGDKMTVIGTLAVEGESLVNPLQFDECIMVGYEYAKRIANVNPGDAMFTNIGLNVKVEDGVPVEQMKDEITGILRARRRIKPREDDNFSLNELSLVSNALNGFFSVLNIIGWVIGGLALIVGGFSVANIMFVSVKERTNIIGIKKALGAKPYIILLEFLIESIILCILGGILGLLFIFGLLAVLKDALPYPIYLDVNNAIFGVVVSVIIGILAGLIPAFQAARMDPVEAMRQ